MPVYAAATVPGAPLLLSGIAEDRLELVLDAIPEDLTLVRREADGPWILLALERR
jgi:ribosomal protein L11 methylase PrmA